MRFPTRLPRRSRTRGGSTNVALTFWLTHGAVPYLRLCLRVLHPVPDRRLLLDREPDEFHTALQFVLMPHKGPRAQDVRRQRKPNLNPNRFTRRQLSRQNSCKAMLAEIHRTSRQSVGNTRAQHAHVNRHAYKKSGSMPPRRLAPPMWLCCGGHSV